MQCCGFIGIWVTTASDLSNRNSAAVAVVTRVPRKCNPIHNRCSQHSGRVTWHLRNHSYSTTGHHSVQTTTLHYVGIIRIYAEISASHIFAPHHWLCDRKCVKVTHCYCICSRLMALWRYINFVLLLLLLLYEDSLSWSYRIINGAGPVLRHYCPSCPPERRTACHRIYDKIRTSSISSINRKHFCLGISQPRRIMTVCYSVP